MAREDLSARGRIDRYVQREDGGYDEVSIVQKPGGEYVYDPEKGKSRFSFSDRDIDPKTGKPVEVSGDRISRDSYDPDAEKRANEIIRRVEEKRRSEGR